jgi:hypothetical protein
METNTRARFAVVFFRNTENLNQWLKLLPEWACTTTTDEFVVVTVAFDESIEARSFLTGFLATSWPFQQIGPIFVGRSPEELQALMEQWLQDHQ